MLSLNNLPLKNLKGNFRRSIVLLLFSTLMAASLFGGTLMILGVNQGLNTVRSRLGADMLVTPEDAKNDFDAQTVLLQAEPGYFYMDAEVLSQVQQIKGVKAASPQLFLASTSSGCCSAKLQIIAFDPESDFTIQPWIGETFGPKKMGVMDIIVGANITVYDDHIIRLYGNDCSIIGQFAPTGSSLDNAVYTTFDTVKILMRASFDLNLNKYTQLDPNGVISAVVVRVKPGENIEEVAESIRKNVPGVSVATSKNMVSGIAAGIGSISNTISLFIGVFWVIGLLMTLLLFGLMIHERKREFASLEAFGADRQILTGIITKEAILIHLTGGIIGIALSFTVLLGFRKVIEQGLDTGLLFPGIGQILILFLITVTSVIGSAGLSAIIAVRQIYHIDSSLVLKEGE